MIIGAAAYSLVTCNRLPWVIIGVASCTGNHLPWVIIGAAGCSLVTGNHLPWVIIGAAGYNLVTLNETLMSIFEDHKMPYLDNISMA